MGLWIANVHENATARVLGHQLAEAAHRSPRRNSDKPDLAQASEVHAGGEARADGPTHASYRLAMVVHMIGLGRVQLGIWRAVASGRPLSVATTRNVIQDTLTSVFLELRLRQLCAS